MKIYCFGNEAIGSDSMAKKLARELRVAGAEFVLAESPEELFEDDSPEVYVMDVADGITEPILLEGLSQLKENRMVSLHDFDLAFFLKLMRNIGKEKKLKIIAVPRVVSKLKVEAFIKEKIL